MYSHFNNDEDSSLNFDEMKAEFLTKWEPLIKHKEQSLTSRWEVFSSTNETLDFRQQCLKNMKNVYADVKKAMDLDALDKAVINYLIQNARTVLAFATKKAGTEASRKDIFHKFEKIGLGSFHEGVVGKSPYLLPMLADKSGVSMNWLACKHALKVLALELAEKRQEMQSFVNNDSINQLVLLLAVDRGNNDEISNLQCEIKAIIYGRKSNFAKEIESSSANELFKMLSDIEDIKDEFKNKLGLSPRDQLSSFDVEDPSVARSSRLTNSPYSYFSDRLVPSPDESKEISPDNIGTEYQELTSERRPPGGYIRK
jgi:hypothetical protein